MNQFTTLFTLVVFVSLVFTGCKSTSQTAQSEQAGEHNHNHDISDQHSHDDSLAHSACTCDSAKLENGWCDDCNVGYVAGQRISYRLLFETLDAHGHDVNIEAMTCETCLIAIPVSGFCESHRLGFVDNKAYFSKLTYSLAKGGEAHNVSNLTCTTCRTHAQDHGWCNACKIGMVGNVAFRNQDEYKTAAEQFTILTHAINKASDCEMCACAMIVDSRCPTCKISYQDGRPILDR